MEYRDYKTVKELSEQLGVSKPAITKFMSSTFRSKYTKKESNRLLIDIHGVQAIKAHFQDSSHVKSKTNQKLNDNLSKSYRKVNADQEELLYAKDETIKLLKQQLTEKDKQLKQRSDEIASMHKLMDQNQQLLLNTQAENKRLLSLQMTTKSSQKIQEGDFDGKANDNDKVREKASESREDNSKIIDKINGKKKLWWQFWKKWRFDLECPIFYWLTEPIKVILNVSVITNATF